jgi:hypothetical protein
MNKLAYMQGYMEKEAFIRAAYNTPIQKQALLAPTAANVTSILHAMTPKMVLTTLPAKLGYKPAKAFLGKFDKAQKLLSNVGKRKKWVSGVLDHIIKSPLERVR